MPIVVAPATHFHPAIIVTEDVFGDSTGTISGHALAKSFQLRAEGIAVHGDATTIAGAGSGGDDHFLVTGVDPAAATLVFGDAEHFVGRAHGGDDDIVTKKHAIAFGDAFDLTEHSICGDDRIVVPSVAPTNEIQAYGDGSRLEQCAQGGDDCLYGNLLIGDAGRITGNGRGGDDHLFGRGDALLFGDAVVMKNNARGGDDRL